MGFFDSFAKGWSFMRAAFAMARDNKRLLTPSLYLVLASIAYFVAWVVALISLEPKWSHGTWTAVGAIASFGSFLISYFFCGITVNMIDVHLKGGTPSLADGVRAARKNFLALMFLAIVSTIVDLLARSTRKKRSIVGRIIADLVEAVWTTVTFLLLPTIIIEDAGFGDALRRVRTLHDRNMLLIGVGEVGVRLVTGLVGLLWLVLTCGVLYVSFAALHGAAAVFAAFVVGGTLLALYAAFSTYLRMAYYTCLYLWAADVEKQGARAPAPLPLAIALGSAGGDGSQLFAAPSPMLAQTYVPPTAPAKPRLPDSLSLDGPAPAAEPAASAPLPADGPRVQPAGVAKLVHYAATAIELSSGGFEARLETGAVRRVLWSEVVGLVARRLPAEAPFDGATFLDIVSVAGATVRVLPWTRRLGDATAGTDRADELVQTLAARCSSAKLDAATRAFAAGEAPALQLPDLAMLAAHDQRMA